MEKDKETLFSDSDSEEENDNDTEKEKIITQDDYRKGTIATDDDYIELFEPNKKPPHEDFYEEFKLPEVNYDLNDVIDFLGKKWKMAKYKEHTLKNFLISEDSQLYSKYSKTLILEENNRLKIRDDGEWVYPFTINGNPKSLCLRDIVASTFLKVPSNAVISTYRKWNYNNPQGKYYGQSRHYTNLYWLTEDDLKYISTPEEKLQISVQGDIYSTRKGYFKMLKEEIVNNVRIVRTEFTTGNNKGKWISLILHKLVGQFFVKRPDDSYKYLFFKNNNRGDIHKSNMIWLNTLSGVKGDKIRYFEIPNCPGYVLSETNIPFSFKRGYFKQMKTHMDYKGYNHLALYNSKKERKLYMFSRIVAATRRDDFDPFLYVDHGDNQRNHDVPENLSSVTQRENCHNIREDYIRGKRIIQLTPDEEFVKVHNNAISAAKEFGSEENNFIGAIRRTARNNGEMGRNMFKDYIWRYVNPKLPYIPKKGEYFIPLKGIFQGVELQYENYKFSNFGTMVNIVKGYKKAYSNIFYPYVTLAKFSNREKENWAVHIIMGLLFVPGRTDERNQIHHKDEDPSNYASENLEWLTAQENILRSAYQNGIPVKKICMETGKVLGIYDTRADAAESCGKKRKDGSHIGRVIDPKYKKISAFGYFWENIKEEDIPLYLELKRNQKKKIDI